MSDNIPSTRQRQCATLSCEDKKYFLDIYRCVQSGLHGCGESRKQLSVFITRAIDNNTLPFFQEEQHRLEMKRVYHDKFCWKQNKVDEMLIVQMKMEDFSSASKPIERRKVDEMKITEKVTFTLPCCDATNMRFRTKLLNGSVGGEVLLETEQLNVNLSPIPCVETKQGVEHDHVTSRPTEQAPVAQVQMLA